MNRQGFTEIVNRIQYKNWKVVVEPMRCDYCGHPEKCYLQIEWFDLCTTTGQMCRHTGRKWLLSEHMTESEVVLTALKAVLTAEEHEARENFRYNGKQIVNPHPSIAALNVVADNQEVRK